MADDIKNNIPNSNPADGGQEPRGKQEPQGTEPPLDKTFTQAELEAILAERLKREREKYKDFDAYKKAAEELQALKESQMSEQEKLQAKLAEYEKKLQEKERETEQARIESMKLHILDEMGLPKAWANRMFGNTVNLHNKLAPLLQNKLVLKAA